MARIGDPGVGMDKEARAILKQLSRIKTEHLFYWDNKDMEFRTSAFRDHPESGAALTVRRLSEPDRVLVLTFGRDSVSGSIFVDQWVSSAAATVNGPSPHDMNRSGLQRRLIRGGETHNAIIVILALVGHFTNPPGRKSKIPNPLKRAV